MIRTDLSNEQYHAEKDHDSSSALKLYLKDPVAYHKQYVLRESSSIPSALQAVFDFGTYVHTMVLEPHLLETEYIYFDDCEGLDAKKELQKDNPDKTIITLSQKAQADKMYKGFKEATFYPYGKKISTFFNRGKSEESFFGELEGLPIKVRSDYRKQTKKAASINDVKTTSKHVNRKNVVKVCQELGYDVSAALYVDLVTKITGVEHDFYFTFMGKKDFKTEVFRASKEFLENGRVKYKKAIAGIKKSRETNVWIAEV